MNSQSFTPEECASGLHLDLVNYLLDYNKKSKECYYDIHISSDGYCTIIEWTRVHYEGMTDESKFVYLGEDELIMKEVRMPDGSYEPIYRDQDPKKCIEEWYASHSCLELEEYDDDDLPF